MPTRLLVLAAGLAHRLPILLRAYSCVPRLQLVALVLTRELSGCWQVIATARMYGACPGSNACTCAELKHTQASRHLEISRWADGSGDLIFTHADLWIHMPRLLARLTLMKPGGALGTPGGGMEVGGRHVESQCVPMDEMKSCTAGVEGTPPRSDAVLTCRGHRWFWWDNSSLECRAAASELGGGLVTSCCYGWADLVILPARAHESFARLARAFARTFHEVAIPTIVHAISSNEALGQVPHHPLQCVGSCCSRVEDPLGNAWGHHRIMPRAPNWRRVGTDSNVVCAHRLSLGHLASINRAQAYDGIYAGDHACRIDLFHEPRMQQLVNFSMRRRVFGS